MVHISRQWRHTKLLLGLTAAELLDVIACLVFFGVANPDTYRTSMWQVGSDNGFNSSPLDVLFAYANYRPLPTTPMVWSAFITQYNVVVSIFTLFLLLVKAIAYIMNIWRPPVALVGNIVLIGLWCVSIYGQAGPDYSDPAHPSRSAWYLRYSCDYATPSGQYGHCMQAKASFAVSCIMLIIIVLNLSLSIWSLFPTKEEMAERRQRLEDCRALEETSGTDEVEKAWELGIYPRSPASAAQPYTPRTMASYALERKLPLRSASD